MISKRSLAGGALLLVTLSTHFALAMSPLSFGGMQQLPGSISGASGMHQFPGSISGAARMHQFPGSISGARSGQPRAPLSEAAIACIKSVFADLKVARDAEHSCITAILTAQGIDPASLRSSNRQPAAVSLSADVKAQIEACRASGPSAADVKAEIEACGK